MEGNRKINIIILGTLGIGKSTVMNRMTGSEPFKASDKASGVTVVVNKYEFEYNGYHYKVIDSPGMNDCDMDMTTWLATFKKAAKIETEPIHLVICAYKAEFRPSSQDKNNLVTIVEIIKGLSPDNLGLLFTFCDKTEMREINDDGIPRHEGWTKTLLKSVKNEI